MSPHGVQLYRIDVLGAALGTPSEGQRGVKKNGDTREMRLPKEGRQKVGDLEPAAQVRIPSSASPLLPVEGCLGGSDLL